MTNLTSLEQLLKVLKQYETGYIGYSDLVGQLVEITYLAQIGTIPDKVPHLHHWSSKRTKEAYWAKYGM